MLTTLYVCNMSNMFFNLIVVMPVYLSSIYLRFTLQVKDIIFMFLKEIFYMHFIVPVEYTFVQSPSEESTRLCWGNSIASSTTRGTSSSQSNTKSSVVYDTTWKKV